MVERESEMGLIDKWHVYEIGERTKRKKTQTYTNKKRTKETEPEEKKRKILISGSNEVAR